MTTKEELLLLKTKILPQGADAVLDFLASRPQFVEWTQIVLENVPLLILGRHGMIARIPVGGVVQKVSQSKEIIDMLKVFFQKQDKLFIFVNLPDLPLPAEVTRLLEEVQGKTARKDRLRALIDEALDRRDKELFTRASDELQSILDEEATESFEYLRRPRF